MQALMLMDKPRRAFSLDTVRNRVGEQLKAIIAERGVSQAELAKTCGLSSPRFNNYVTGFRTPDLDTLMRMAKHLGTTTDYLLGFNSELPDIGAVVLRLLELEGIEQSRAEVIADTAQEALTLLLALPAEGDAGTRSRIAAQAAWQLRGGPKPLQ